MWSAFHTARAIALAVKPYYEQKEMNVQLELVDEILKDTISPREAFMKAMTIEFDNGLDRFCHVIESDRYNAYINEHISDLFFASIFWQKLQNIFGECCISKLEKVAKPRLAAVLPAA